MPMSTCIKCGGHTFEVVEAKPNNSDFTLMFVQCSSCGGVVGVMDYLNIGYFVEKIAKKLDVK